MVDLKGKKLMMLKDPIQILMENLSATLGSPQDIAKIISNQANFELDKEVEIPRSKEIASQSQQAAPVAAATPVPVQQPAKKAEPVRRVE